MAPPSNASVIDIRKVYVILVDMFVADEFRLGTAIAAVSNGGGVLRVYSQVRFD